MVLQKKASQGKMHNMICATNVFHVSRMQAFALVCKDHKACKIEQETQARKEKVQAQVHQ